MDENKIITITQTTAKRLISDIKDITKNSLAKEGIYYKHDEKNMLIGYALIIGSKDTPYAFGNFLFRFNFPHDYPHAPPKVTYLTNDGITRFHPNLYKNGKVCLSVLNTWKGEQWTGSQTIRSIRLSLASILDDCPLINEPGIEKNHPDVKPYSKIIDYKCKEVAIYKILTGDLVLHESSLFFDEMRENFLKNFNEIIDLFNSKKEKEDKEDKEDNEDNKIISTKIYNLYCKINRDKLEKQIVSLFKKLQ